MEKKPVFKLRIHGDNILECENALKLLAVSLNGEYKDCKIVEDGPAYAPIYKLESSSRGFLIQLFPGYGRWSFSITDYLAARGAPVREATDAIITKFEEDKNIEIPILSLEFSGALPAGNNAWQRTGRALALAYAGIPYLYFTELGGHELGSDRSLKAARFPNPLVPFAYSTLGPESGTISMPVYIPSPSLSGSIPAEFIKSFGFKEAAELVKSIILESSTSNSQKALETKLLNLIGTLSDNRKKKDTLSAAEWKELYSKKTGTQKADWLVERKFPWNKKLGIKSLTRTFLALLRLANKNKAVAIGSKEIPICLIPKNKRIALATDIKKLYKNRVSEQFIEWLSKSDKHLLCVWIAGFKPRGDDSRPDRGLVPLARMIFGMDHADLLSIVYGPAHPTVWAQLAGNMHRLASINGLWEAIVNLSDGIIVDSITSKKIKNIGFVTNKPEKKIKKIPLAAAEVSPIFGEHDVDSVLHLLFSNAITEGIYESLCNPPGGDWSGINIIDFQNNIEFRWTSLPRVSGADSKRPDHLVQIGSGAYLVPIESKDIQARLEDEVGVRLVKYVSQLLSSNPISIRSNGQQWQSYKNENRDKKLKILSAVAFRFQKLEELKLALKKCKSDVAIGVEFISGSYKTIIHVMHTEQAKHFGQVIKELAARYPKILEVKIES